MRSVSINMHGIKSVSVGKPVPFTDPTLSGSYTTLTITDNADQHSTVTLMSDVDDKPVEIILEEK